MKAGRSRGLHQEVHEVLEGRGWAEWSTLYQSCLSSTKEGLGQKRYHMRAEVGWDWAGTQRHTRSWAGWSGGVLFRYPGGRWRATLGYLGSERRSTLGLGWLGWLD